MLVVSSRDQTQRRGPATGVLDRHCVVESSQSEDVDLCAMMPCSATSGQGNETPSASTLIHRDGPLNPRLHHHPFNMMRDGLYETSGVGLHVHSSGRLQTPIDQTRGQAAHTLVNLCARIGWGHLVGHFLLW